MASVKSSVARFSRPSASFGFRAATHPSPPIPTACQHVRWVSQKFQKAKEPAKKKNKKQNTHYVMSDLKRAQMWSLCDALQYIRAFEVGRPPTSAKIDVAIRLQTRKNSPTVRNHMRLPHPVKTDLRVCVICPPDGEVAKVARAAGASLVGDDAVFDAVKDGRIEFDRCLCHTDSFQKMNKAGLGRVLGPRGLMPSPKLGTVVKDISSTLKDMMGGSQYRERDGVLRMAVAQLGFTPEEVRKNIAAFMANVRKDIAQLSDSVTKEVHEVVLSSTHSPGFILNGEFRSPESVPTQDLSTLD